MDDRPSREEIIQRIEAAHDHFVSALTGLTPEQMLEPGAVGFWSVKDVLAHLIFWNVFPVEEIEGALNGETFPHPQETDDEINARSVAKHRTSSLAAVREDFETTYEHILETVRELPDEAFKPDGRFEQALGDTVNGALANNTYEHWPVHEAQIRAWIEQHRTA